MLSTTKSTLLLWATAYLLSLVSLSSDGAVGVDGTFGGGHSGRTVSLMMARGADEGAGEGGGGGHCTENQSCGGQEEVCFAAACHFFKVIAISITTDA